MFPAADYLDLSQTVHSELFADDEPVWAALGKIEAYLHKLLDSVDGPLIHGSVDPKANIGGQVYVAADAIVEAFATIQGPAWIGPNTIVRAGAYLRQNVIVGENCVLGNSSEFKNCVLFDNCEVPHFNYVGDSILGYKAHLGAGVICSNVRLDRENVKVKTEDGFADSELRKFGAIVGDRTEVGCNSVLNPGSILGKDCIVYPGCRWSGVLESKKIVKVRQEHITITRRS